MRDFYGSFCVWKLQEGGDCSQSLENFSSGRLCSPEVQWAIIRYNCLFFWSKALFKGILIIRVGLCKAWKMKRKIHEQKRQNLGISAIVASTPEQTHASNLVVHQTGQIIDNLTPVRLRKVQIHLLRSLAPRLLRQAPTRWAG